MTALHTYKRLEALGLWRENAEEQRREVVVGLGDATLVLSSTNGEALGHWSLPALVRRNPGQRPGIFTPSEAEAAETLEISDPEMLEALDKITAAIDRARPRPGRLRFLLVVGLVFAVVVSAVIWLPGALIQQTVALLPQAKRVDIGQQLLAEITRIGGQPCRSPGGQVALDRLAVRTFGPNNAPDIVLLPDSIPDTFALPGNIIVASAALAEDHETADVLAGYLLAESLRQEAQDPVEHLLQSSGLGVTFRLLTTGNMAQDAIHAHAAEILSQDRPAVDDAALLQRFARAEISSEPYAYARDVSGESVLELIEGNPMRSVAGSSVLADSDWIRLQEICTD